LSNLRTDWVECMTGSYKLIIHTRISNCFKKNTQTQSHVRYLSFSHTSSPDLTLALALVCVLFLSSTHTAALPVSLMSSVLHSRVTYTHTHTRTHTLSQHTRIKTPAPTANHLYFQHSYLILLFPSLCETPLLRRPLSNLFLWILVNIQEIHACIKLHAAICRIFGFWHGYYVEAPASWRLAISAPRLLFGLDNNSCTSFAQQRVEEKNMRLGFWIL